MGNFLKAGNVDVVALCDIYDAQFDKAKQAAPNAKTYTITARCSISRKSTPR